MNGDNISRGVDKDCFDMQLLIVILYCQAVLPIVIKELVFSVDDTREFVKFSWCQLLVRVIFIDW